MNNSKSFLLKSWFSVWGSFWANPDNTGMLYLNGRWWSELNAIFPYFHCYINFVTMALPLYEFGCNLTWSFISDTTTFYRFISMKLFYKAGVPLLYPLCNWSFVFATFKDILLALSEKKAPVDILLMSYFFVNIVYNFCIIKHVQKYHTLLALF